MEGNKEKPEVGKAILFGIIGIVAFYVVNFILSFAFAFLLAWIVKTPIFNIIFKWFTWLREDEYLYAAIVVSGILSALSVTWMIQRFCDDDNTEVLSVKIFAAILIVINLLLLFYNRKYGNPIFTNIFLGVVGICAFSFSK